MTVDMAKWNCGIKEAYCKYTITRKEWKCEAWRNDIIRALSSHFKYFSLHILL